MHHYIGTNSTQQQSIQFRTLTKDQCIMIYEAALRILNRTGCVIKHEKALSILKENGARIDNGRVKIPYHMVEGALKSIPKQVTLYNTEGEPQIHLSARNGKSYWCPGAENQYIVDRHTQRKRLTTKKDALEAGLLCEALPYIDLATGLCFLEEPNPNLADVYETRILLEATKKPLLCWQLNKKNLQIQTELFSSVAGGLNRFIERPFAISSSTPSTPLCHNFDTLEKAIYQWDKGIPNIYSVTALLGVVTPANIASGYAVALADIFVGMLLSQLINPGCPFLAGAGIIPFDTKQMSPALSSPEVALSAAGISNIFYHLNIPNVTFLGGSDAVTFDQQAAGDISQQILMGTLSGCNLSIFMGYLETGVSCSLESLVYSNEVIDMARFITKGIEISYQTLDEDIIDQIGPQGNFLNEEHILNNLTSHWDPHLFTRISYEKWEKEGEKDTQKRCAETVDKIVEKGITTNRDPLLLQELDQIIQKA